jgi:hypothetical protein
MGFCKCGNEFFGSMKSAKVLDFLGYCQLLKKDFTIWSLVS